MERLVVMYKGHNEVMDERIREYIGSKERQSGYFVPTDERDMTFDIPADWSTSQAEELMDIGSQYSLTIQIADAM